jgi:hypothetical protein
LENSRLAAEGGGQSFVTSSTSPWAAIFSFQAFSAQRPRQRSITSATRKRRNSTRIARRKRRVRERVLGWLVEFMTGGSEFVAV